MVTVFLGGTCNGSTWREELLVKLDPQKVHAFNPIVKEWNEQAQRNEIAHRENDDICLYVITPEMTGFYSIAEVVDDSNKRPAKTVFCVLPSANGKNFDQHQMKSLVQTGKMVAKNGGKVLNDLDEVAKYLNEYSTSKGNYDLYFN